MIKKPFTLLAAAIALVLVAATSANAAVDVEAAKALAKADDCLKCHAAEKEKKGPSMKEIADKYRGKPEGQEKAIKNMTEAMEVELRPKGSGKKEKHKVISTKKPEELKNMADWYLSH
ncbi:MAG: c-type cytochrome [Rhodoferax sp.]|jgi:cytochrome c|nr:c-type cytochrome [Rhodoferax sp.]